MSEYKSYPKWKYHAEKEAQIVHDEQSDKALGDSWVESPAHVKSVDQKFEKQSKIKLDKKKPIESSGEALE